MSPSTAAAYIASYSEDVVATINSAVTLEVMADGIPSDITYQWRKNGNVSSGETSNALSLASVMFSDSGVYQCIPSNSEGSHNSTTIRVDIRGWSTHNTNCTVVLHIFYID